MTDVKVDKNVNTAMIIILQGAIRNTLDEQRGKPPHSSGP